MPIRPGGLNSTSQASASVHHGTVGAQGTATAATVEIAAVTLAQRRPTSANIGTISSACAKAARRGVGTTSRSRVVVALSRSSRAASAPSFGWTYRSFTDTCGWRVRIRATSCAAVRLPPPWVKKSAFGSVDRHAEDLRPAFGQPGFGRRQQARRHGVEAARGQRPGQRVPVDLARGARRHVVDDREQRHQRGGQPVAQGERRGVGVKASSATT